MILTGNKRIHITRCELHRRYILPVVSILLLQACLEEPLTANDDVGEDKLAKCGACHGLNGISNIPIIPNLAGQKAEYTVLQLKAFRSGERVNAAMTPHAKSLSDQDIADLAAHYANLDPSGKSSSSP
ncbi:c-type cytochrome [Agaribacter marinus]|uniref:Cytochrome c554 n=1 Tax=Agaribacter marinus TaxID=1431249 RepID=A0AA37SV19_9ALTE|nr:cytochrome c [Agaribacter marinus]GLR69224.1 cytochrome c554 [Agaribacter marinus]